MSGDIIEIATFLTFLLLVGAIAGVIAGLLGVGGGILIVPALYFVLTALNYPHETLMHVCVATSLATIAPTSWRSLRSHAKRGAVDWAVLRGWGPYLGVGAIAGVVLAAFLPTRALTGVFGVMVFLVSLHMIFSRSENEVGMLGTEPPVGGARAGVASATGVLSAMMGIGGGTFGVPLLNLYGVAIHRAVATAAGFGLVIAVPSIVGFIIAGFNVPAELKPPFTLGYVNLAAFAVITPMTVLSAPVGVRIAHAINPKPLKTLFGFFLAVAALNMLRKAGLG